MSTKLVINLIFLKIDFSICLKGSSPKSICSGKKLQGFLKRPPKQDWNRGTAQLQRGKSWNNLKIKIMIATNQSPLLLPYLSEINKRREGPYGLHAFST